MYAHGYFSVNLDSASPWSLYATFTLFLLGGDLKMIKLILQKLKSFELDISKKAGDHSEFIYHYCVLLSCLYVSTVSLYFLNDYV